MGWGSTAALPVLRGVGGDLYSSVGPIDAPVLVEVAGDTTLRITDPFDIASLSAIGGSLLIEMSGTEDLRGLASLGSVGGDVEIVMSALESTAGLEALRTVGGGLTLWVNDALVDVTALHGVTLVGGDLTVQYNPTLAAADAEALSVEIDVIGGAVTISDNGP